MFIYINVYGSIINDCKIKYLDNIIMSENNNEQESVAGPDQSGNAAEENEVIIDLGQKDDIEEETKEDIPVSTGVSRANIVLYDDLKLYGKMRKNH